MNTDIRIKIGQPDHIKTKKLVTLAGERAYRCLIRLWAKIAQDHPSGDVEMSPADIELIADWTGEKGKFAQALIDTKYFDMKENGLVSHDWSEHQSWAVHAESRRAVASNAAKVKWDNIRAKKNDAQSNARSMHDACTEHAQSNAPSPLPSPSPIPSQKSKRPELTLKLQEILANELHVKVLYYHWDWSCLNELKISNEEVLELYRLLFDPDMPGWAKKDRNWLLTKEAPRNLLKHYQKFKDQAAWEAKEEPHILDSWKHKGQNVGK